MKSTLKLLVLLMCLLPLNLKAQENIKYSKVVKVENTTAETLYNRAIEWFSENFKNPEMVIKIQDREQGKIIAKTNIDYTPSRFCWGGTTSAKGTIDFVIKLYFKENRFKYDITEFQHVPYQSGAKSFGYLTTNEAPPFKSYLGMKKRARFLWNDLKEKAEQTGKLVASSLTTGLQKPTETENDDW